MVQIKIAVLRHDGMRVLVGPELGLNVVDGLSQFPDGGKDQFAEQPTPGRVGGALQHAGVEMGNQMLRPGP